MTKSIYKKPFDSLFERRFWTIEYYNPKNKIGFFSDWHKSDEIKLDYLLIGILFLIMIISFVVIYQ